MLRKGAKGERVKEIQRLLKITVDGDFGPKTKAAVISFQKANNLLPDGIVGPKTLAVMKTKGLENVNSTTQIETIPLMNMENVLDIIDANCNEDGKIVIPKNPKNDKETVYDPTKHLTVVSVRGFKLEMGSSKSNDRRIYDDAHFIVTPSSLVTYAGNTDPNGWRKGYGYGSAKGMAMLDTGVWAYGKGKHRGRLAFRQAMPFTVIRDGNPPYPHNDYHAINWHSGGLYTTSSLGCQTNKPEDFYALRTFIYRELDRLDNPKMYNDWAQYDRAFPYILIEEEERRKGNFKV